MRGKQKPSRLIFSLVAILFLLQSVNAAQSTSSNWYDNVYFWVGISIAISATFLGLAYMAGKLFQIQMLTAWVKIEVNELAASMIIAVFCVALIASVNTAAQFLTGEENTSVIDSSRDFLKGSVYSHGAVIHEKLSEAYFNAARVASYAYTAGVSVGVMSFSASESPASGLSPLVAQIGQGIDTVTNFMLLASAQSAFLKFFQSAAAVMLPVGIFLRSFSLTRKIGGVVLAAVIASAVIYPAGFFISKEVYGAYSADMLSDASKIKVTDAGNPPLAGMVCNPWMQRFVQSPLPFLGGETGWWISICTPICTAISLFTAGAGFWPCMEECGIIVFDIFMVIKSAFPIIAYGAVLMPFARSIGTSGNLIDGYYEPLAEFALPAVAKFSVLSLVVFLIPVIIAMTLLRNFAIIFGGEPQLYGISKLV